MSYILDTHTLIWLASDDEQLPEKCRNIIKNVSIDCFASIASFWEITIKTNLKKLQYDYAIDEFYGLITANKIHVLPISIAELTVYEQLFLYHKDPFDRMIISQAIANDLIIISKDKFLDKYGVRVVW